MKCNQYRPGFELVSPCSFPTAITTTPRAPPYSYIFADVDQMFMKSDELNLIFLTKVEFFFMDIFLSREVISKVFIVFFFFFYILH